MSPRKINITVIDSMGILSCSLDTDDRAFRGISGRNRGFCGVNASFQGIEAIV